MFSVSAVSSKHKQVAYQASQISERKLQVCPSIHSLSFSPLPSTFPFLLSPSLLSLLLFALPSLSLPLSIYPSPGPSQIQLMDPEASVAGRRCFWCILSWKSLFRDSAISEVFRYITNTCLRWRQQASQGASVMPWDFGGESKPPLLLDHGDPEEQ